jgi:hypothetical protein
MWRREESGIDQEDLDPTKVARPVEMSAIQKQAMLAALAELAGKKVDDGSVG